MKKVSWVSSGYCTLIFWCLILITIQNRSVFFRALFCVVAGMHVVMATRPLCQFQGRPWAGALSFIPDCGYLYLGNIPPAVF